MRIAVASGKGGTGKTTVATNLAYVAPLDGRKVAYVDCDVEEPNGHLFLRPEITSRSPMVRLVPEVEQAKCTLCGLCGEICQYSAIMPVGKTVLVYAELCHACGGCVLVCPSEAITEQPRGIGRLETGNAGAIQFVHGLLNVGEAMSPLLIRQVKEAAPDAQVVLIDAPPGTSCPVIESVRGADYVLLVTEPTPFGLHDLKLAVEMVQALKMSFGVVTNRAGMGDNQTAAYCRANRIEIIAEIPDDRRIAEAYSRSAMICEALPEYRSLFEELLKRITKETKASGDRDWQAEIRLLQKREQRAREMLGVPDSAGKEDIKRAWRRESLKHHPDRNGGSAESHRSFILVNCAYRFLTEGLGCDELDSEGPAGRLLTDGKYRLDNPWGYFAWRRDNYF